MQCMLEFIIFILMSNLHVCYQRVFILAAYLVLSSHIFRGCHDLEVYLIAVSCQLYVWSGTLEIV